MREKPRQNEKPRASVMLRGVQFILNPVGFKQRQVPQRQPLSLFQR